MPADFLQSSEVKVSGKTDELMLNYNDAHGGPLSTRTVYRFVWGN